MHATKFATLVSWYLPCGPCRSLWWESNTASGTHWMPLASWASTLAAWHKNKMFCHQLSSLSIIIQRQTKTLHRQSTLWPHFVGQLPAQGYHSMQEIRASDISRSKSLTLVILWRIKSWNSEFWRRLSIWKHSLIPSDSGYIRDTCKTIKGLRGGCVKTDPSRKALGLSKPCLSVSWK